MDSRSDILLRIKKSVKATDPDAIVILYGSFARGDEHKGSDIDLIILLNKDNISRDDEKRVKYPLYDIEFESGQIISPMVISKNNWDTLYRITPLYENVTSEGIEL